MTAPLTTSQRAKLEASSLARLAYEKREQARLREIAEEVARIAEDKKRKTAAGKRRIGEITLSEGGHTRTVKRYLTTLDLLEQRGQLSKELKGAFAEFARVVAASSGASVEDNDRRSTTRGIASLDSAGTNGFGPKSISLKVLEAQRKSQYIWGHIPEGMMRLARHLIDEETAYALQRPPPLTEYGHGNGFNQEQQARASGATMAIDLCRIVHHALKSR